MSDSPLKNQTRTDEEKRQQSHRNKINAGWGLIEYTALVITLLVLTPLLIKYLGTEAFGLLVIVNTVLGLNGVFSLGIGPATLRYVAKYREEEDEQKVCQTIQTSAMVSVALGAVFGLGLLCLGIAAWTRPEWFSESNRELLSILGVVGFFLPVILTNNVTNHALRGFERFDIAVTVRAGVRIVVSAAQIALVLLGYDLFTLVVAQLFLQAGGTLYTWFVLNWRLTTSRSWFPHFHRSAFDDFVHFGAYTWISSIVGTIRQSGELFIVAGILGPIALTYYTIPVRVLSQVHTLLARVFAYQFPYISKLSASDDTAEIERAYKAGTRALCVFSSLAITPLAVCCGPLLNAWLGSEVATEVFPIAQILSIRYAVFPLSILNYNFLLATGRAKLMTIVMAINTLLALPLVAVLSYYMGVRGAAYAQWFVLATIIFNRCLIEKELFQRIRVQTAVVPVFACVGPLIALLLTWQIPLSSPLTSLPVPLIVSAAIGAGVAYLACYQRAELAPSLET